MSASVPISVSPVQWPPLHPIAPTTCPSTLIGWPPPKTTRRSTAEGAPIRKRFVVLHDLLPLMGRNVRHRGRIGLVDRDLRRSRVGLVHPAESDEEPAVVDHRHGDCLLDLLGMGKGAPDELLLPPPA